MVRPASRIPGILPRAAWSCSEVEGDPLEDVHVLGKVNFVMKEGVVFKQDPSTPQPPIS